MSLQQQLCTRQHPEACSTCSYLLQSSQSANLPNSSTAALVFCDPGSAAITMDKQACNSPASLNAAKLSAPELASFLAMSSTCSPVNTPQAVAQGRAEAGQASKHAIANLTQLNINMMLTSLHPLAAKN